MSVQTIRVEISSKDVEYLDCYEIERAIKTGLRYKYGANTTATVLAIVERGWYGKNN